MITIECGSLEGCSKLEEIKTIKKLRVIAQPIRINKNIAKNLLANSLIVYCDNTTTYQTYSLTKKGAAAKLVYENFDLSLDAFLRIEDISKWLSKVIKKRKFVFKTMITTCFSCGKEFKRHDLEHVQDGQCNDGMYCKNCLRQGYQYALSQMKERKHAICGSKDSGCTSRNTVTD